MDYELVSTIVQGKEMHTGSDAACRNEPPFSLDHNEKSVSTLSRRNSFWLGVEIVHIDWVLAYRETWVDLLFERVVVTPVTEFL